MPSSQDTVEARASEFLIDMGAVFREFVTVALREALRRFRDGVPRKDHSQPRH